MSLAVHDFTYIQDLIRRESAIMLDPGKEYLVQSRLLPVAKSVGEESVGGLVSRLRRQADRGLKDRVVEAMTTNETSWFRDGSPWKALAEEVLPDLLAKRSAVRRLHIWCAAASSGQEPYTVAMLLADLFATRPGWAASILATDISTEMLQRTREGRYTQLEVNRGLPAAMLVKHFLRDGTHWQLKPELRAMVETRLVNLAAPLPPMPQADVVLLRNVLIYFDVPTKRAVLERVRQVLRPDGYLFLGSSETTLNIHDGFERVSSGRVTCYRPVPDWKATP